MDIKEDEIKRITKIGTLNGSGVQLVTLKGGFHIGMGKKTKNSKKSEILAAGSHPALVCHQISKKYDKKFQENLQKSEGEISCVLSDYSDNLSTAQQNVLGLNMYTIEKNETVSFSVTKNNFEIFSIKATKDDESIFLNKIEKKIEELQNVNKDILSKNLQKTVKQYAKRNNLKIKKKF